MKKINTDFSYGEISTKWDGRADLPYYTKGVSELRNMYVMPQGVVGRISGTKYITLLPTGNWSWSARTADPIKLYPFTASGNLKFIVMISCNNVIVYSTSGTQIATFTYSNSTELLSLTQAVQINGVMYIAHPLGFMGYGISKLAYSGGSFTFTSLTTIPASVIPEAGTPYLITGRKVTTFQGRLVAANLKDCISAGAREDAVLASKTLDYENFTLGNNDADAWLTEITNGYVNIKWMMGTEHGLVIGTQDSEHIIEGGDNGLTPTALSQRKLSSFGSSDVIPEQIGLSTIFVERDRRKVRELAYYDTEGSLSSPNLTLLADHITGDGLREIHFQRTPFECLYCIRTDGKIAMLTHDRNTGITAWSLIDVGGYVTGMCMHAGETQDDVYIAVARNVGGKAKYYLEKFDPFEQEDKGNWNYMFSSLAMEGVTKTISNMAVVSDKVVVTTSAAHTLSTDDCIRITDTDIDGDYKVEVIDTTTFYIKDMQGNYVEDFGTDTTGTLNQISKTYAGFTHIPDYEVDVMADGDYIGRYTIDGSGNLTIDRYAHKIIAGIPYTSHLRTMKILQEVGAPVARISKVYIRFYKSMGCKIGQSMDDGEEISVREGELDLGTPALYTGDKEHTMLTEYTKTGHFYIWQDEPMPMNICALACDYRAGGQRQ